MPQLGATFVPGGHDDYYMPEVVAPAPQRVMPEVPQSMQEDIQRMELEAREVEAPRDGNATAPNNQDAPSKSFKPFHTNAPDSAAMDAPSFSPFPKVKGENIPPSDEEKEQILWQARNLVLHSNNVSMQVTWARDALIWVEIAMDARTREWKRENKEKERPPTPKTEHELRVDAMNILEYLAQQDHPEATFMKGKWLEFGKFGFRENKREAYALYKKAAENGFGRAEYRMGMLYENSNDIPNAIKHYSLGVQMGDSASSYRLGMMHLMGQHGYPKDLLLGLEMIQHAADTADEDAPQGAYVYGMLIARELPDINIPEHVLPCDLAVARQYIEKAAYLSFAKAQLKMGQAYELSQLGCDFNPAYSLHYYGLAARQGQPEASLGVSRWFLFGYEDLFPKNEQLAFKYAQDAALSGLATGEFAMGYYHEIGIHVPKDIREARRWYELAADHGNKDAKDRLDSLSQSRMLTKADHETTTLTRIKSQHGSQRGKRPERLARLKDAMPTVSEAEQNAAAGGVDFPDPTPRPPAFAVNVDNSLAMRPKSAAPYPHDDQPPPLNVRPKSTAPYPEDDVRSPHVNPGAHLAVSAGPQADRPNSAFGIRPLSPSAGLPPGGGRGRPMSSQPPVAGWEPQVPPGYRKPSPGPGGQWQQRPPPQQDPRYGAAGGIVPAGTMPVGDPTRARLQKPNPKLQPSPQGPPPGQYPPGGGYPGPASQPGRDYGPSAGNRPVSDSYGPGGYDRHSTAPPAVAGRVPGAPAASSNASLRPHSRGGGGSGRASAPPAQDARPSPGTGAGPGGQAQAQQRPQPGGRPPAQAAPGGNLVHPDGKTMGGGPATFEDMGIPLGKSENDCVVM
ncbi:ed7d2315-b570-47b8-a931-2dac1fd51f46 [Thermothielavioides terrestris]|uniref:Ed7d2315-b570-47b8-a931-2dac1fd51f46 n=1 Tax=Thermothielavioides terrestris TaxID=2587410 RepID=A0A446BTN9_9PEZI|nr:ed7d2315-b570-47b8-a931-2dac1fd51f46 [Thermothielavioides terrestris]